MKLTRIELTNFRCFEHAVFDLTDPETGLPLNVVVLAGGNGSGKSSVLQAVAGAVSQFTNGGAPLPGVGDIRVGAETGKVEVALTDPAEPVRMAVSLAVNLRAPSWVDCAGGDFPMWERLASDAGRRPQGMILAFDVYRLLPAVQIPGPNRSQPAARNHGALAPTLERGGTVNLRFTTARQWIVNLDFQRAKAKADRGVELPAWNILNRGLNTMLAPFEFAGVADDFDVLFKTPTGTVSIDALSDGLRSVFVIIAELMMRLSLCTENPDLLLEQEACCLVDEIDAHLHPRWQQNVMPGLRALFPNVQFIVTTHSPFVIGSVGPHQVFQLEDDTQWLP